MRKSKALCVLLSSILLCGMFACSKEGIGTGTIINPDAAIKLEFQAFDGEYGKDWLVKLAETYCQVNKDVSIHIDWEINMANILNNVEGTAEGAASDYDIVFTTQSPNTLAGKGYIADIKSVYDSTIPGENKTVREKLIEFDPYYNIDGKYYAMPWANAKVAILANLTTLDSVYGDEPYKLPVTTVEWATMCEDLSKRAEATVHPLMWTTSDSYWGYIYYTWWAQYQGVDQYFEFYDGLYRNADGTPDVDGTTEPKFSDNGQIYNQLGRLRAMEELERFINRQNGWSHDASMSYTEAQLAFWGHGYANDDRLGAFMPNGDWVGISMQKWNDRLPQNIVMMKTPVTSSLVEVLPDKSIAEDDDATLAAAIRAIDAGTPWQQRDSALAAVTEDDWNRIAEARSVIADNGTSHFACVPSASKNIEAAKDFLIFMASDAAARIYSSAMNGLLFPYNTTISVTNDTTNTLIASEVQLLEHARSVYWDYSTRLAYLGGINPMRMTGGSPVNVLYAGSKTAGDVFEAMKETGAVWENTLTSAGLDKDGNIIG